MVPCRLCWCRSDCRVERENLEAGSTSGKRNTETYKQYRKRRLLNKIDIRDTGGLQNVDTPPSSFFTGKTVDDRGPFSSSRNDIHVRPFTKNAACLARTCPMTNTASFTNHIVRSSSTSAILLN